MYDFFCIDIVSSSKDTDIQNDNIKDLLLVIKDYLSPYENKFSRCLQVTELSSGLRKITHYYLSNLP